MVDHSKKIRGQISNNEACKKQDRLDYLEEGRKIRENIQNERDKIGNIQQAKLGELKDLGIEISHKGDSRRGAPGQTDLLSEGNPDLNRRER